MTSAPPVVVTGASGFVASHLIRALLVKGHKVRGTIRSLKDTKKVELIRSICPPGTEENLELVEADLLDACCWPGVVEGVHYVYDVANPLRSNSTPKGEPVNPAVQGTLNVLRACSGITSSCTVKRVVITGTAAAVIDHTVPDDCVLDEQHWAPINDANYYIKSKILSEKAAWKFMEDLNSSKTDTSDSKERSTDDDATVSSNSRLELAVVNAGFVLGPVLHEQQNNALGDVIKQIMTGAMFRIPALYMAPIDVRKLAAAHIAAMTEPQAAGQRHLVVEDTLWLVDAAKALHEEFHPMGYKIATSQLPNWLLKLLSWFNSDIRFMLPYVGIRYTLDTSRARDVLGLECGDVRPLFVETAHSMIQAGMVTKTDGYKQPNV